MSVLLVSVVIPTFNMGKFIGEALESVQRQSYNQWEVIVIDDGGLEDGTKTAVDTFAALNSAKRVVYHRLPTNRGVGPARNEALNLVKGAAVAFLDPDDIWLPIHLEKGVTALTSSNSYDLYCSPAQLFWDSKDTLTEYWSFDTWYKECFPWALACRNLIAPSGVVIRKDALIKAGGFTEEPLLQHVEDYELWIRLVNNQSKFHLGEEATFLYRKHARAASIDARQNSQRVEHLIAKHHTTFTRMQGRMLACEAERKKNKRHNLCTTAVAWIRKYLCH